MSDVHGSALGGATGSREEREVRRFAGHQGEVYTVAFSQDSTRALSGGADNTVRIWDVESGQELHCLEGHLGGIWSIAFSPDGRVAASGSGDGSIRLWDVASGE